MELFRQATLLSSMETAGASETDKSAERCGLGTPATRASIIEKLVKCGFVVRKGKQLIPTADGINLISILPEKLASPSLTAEWENALSQVAAGAINSESFMCGIRSLVQSVIDEAGISEDTGFFKTEKEVIGKCPRCSGDVVEGQINFYCTGNDCKFAMWKNNRFWECFKKPLTKTIAAKLLKNSKVYAKGFTSQKTGKTFDATVHMKDTGTFVNFEFEFK